MIQIGITERGDAGLDFSWEEKLKPVNIIISKQLTPRNNRLISALVRNKERIIFHATCTGYGGTVVEPHIPAPEEVHEGVRTLISEGFPAAQIVLRTDPIIPTQKGIQTAQRIWDTFSDLGIPRCRYSVLDMYIHVRERFSNVGIRLPYETFRAPDGMMDAVRRAVIDCRKYSMEACAEDLPGQCGCISERDFEILGVPFEQHSGGAVCAVPERRNCWQTLHGVRADVCTAAGGTDQTETIREKAKTMSMRDYPQLKDVKIPIEQEKIMDILCDAWEECHNADCKKCIDGKRAREVQPEQVSSIMTCVSLKYARKLAEAGYRPVSDSLESKDGGEMPGKG